MKKTAEHKAKLAKKAKDRWQDPEWRKMMVEKQIAAGLRPPRGTDFVSKR